MAVKFSAFTTRTGTLDASTRIVGYDDPAGTKTNVEFTLATLVDNVPTIYNSDGNILATRTINDRAGGFTGTAGSNALKMNVRNSGALMVAGYLNNGDPGTANNCVRWGPGTTVGGMNVKGNLGLTSGGGNISLIASGGSQFLTMNQGGTTIDTSVGIGLTSGVSAQLHVKGADDLNATTGLLVENNSGTDLFFIKNDGTFALGSGATSLSNTNVIIGRDAKDSQATNIESVVIGYSAEVYNALNQDDCVTVGAHSSVRHEGVAIGSASNHYGTKAVSIGYQSSVADNGISIGNLSGVIGGTTANVINIGYYSASSGANSIVINSSGSQANPSTASAFGVYMTSNTTPDFEVVGSGTSTLRTNLNVTGNMEVDGQAWGDLYDGGTIADGATFPPDWNNGNVQKIVIATGAAITVANGTNVNNGATYLLIIEQAGTGGTVTWGGKYKFPAATAPTLTSGAGKADVITMIAYNSASVLCSSTLDFLTT